MLSDKDNLWYGLIAVWVVSLVVTIGKESQQRWCFVIGMAIVLILMPDNILDRNDRIRVNEGFQDKDTFNLPSHSYEENVESGQLLQQQRLDRNRSMDKLRNIGQVRGTLKNTMKEVDPLLDKYNKEYKTWSSSFDSYNDLSGDDVDVEGKKKKMGWDASLRTQELGLLDTQREINLKFGGLASGLSKWEAATSMDDESDKDGAYCYYCPGKAINENSVNSDISKNSLPKCFEFPCPDKIKQQHLRDQKKKAQKDSRPVTADREVGNGGGGRFVEGFADCPNNSTVNSVNGGGDNFFFLKSNEKNSTECSMTDNPQTDNRKNTHTPQSTRYKMCFPDLIGQPICDKAISSCIAGQALHEYQSNPSKDGVSTKIGQLCYLSYPAKVKDDNIMPEKAKSCINDSLADVWDPENMDRDNFKTDITGVGNIKHNQHDSSYNSIFERETAVGETETEISPKPDVPQERRLKQELYETYLPKANNEYKNMTNRNISLVEDIDEALENYKNAYETTTVDNIKKYNEKINSLIEQNKGSTGDYTSKLIPPTQEELNSIGKRYYQQCRTDIAKQVCDSSDTGCLPLANKACKERLNSLPLQVSDWKTAENESSFSMLGNDLVPDKKILTKARLKHLGVKDGGKHLNTKLNTISEIADDIHRKNDATKETSADRFAKYKYNCWDGISTTPAEGDMTWEKKEGSYCRFKDDNDNAKPIDGVCSYQFSSKESEKNYKIICDTDSEKVAQKKSREAAEIPTVPEIDRYDQRLKQALGSLGLQPAS